MSNETATSDDTIRRSSGPGQATVQTTTAGASAAVTFLRISLPLALPGVVGSMLFAFVFAWNEYLFALMLTFQEATTVPLLLASRITSFGTHWDQLSALTLTNLIPAAILGIMLERFLIRNRTEGSLK